MLMYTKLGYIMSTWLKSVANVNSMKDQRMNIIYKSRKKAILLNLYLSCFLLSSDLDRIPVDKSMLSTGMQSCRLCRCHWIYIQDHLGLK